MAAIPSSLVRIFRQVGEVVDLGGDLEDHVPAPPAVAPVGAALRLELLAVHRHRALPPSAGANVDHRLVNKRAHDASIGLPMSPEPVTAWLVRPRDRANAGAVTLRLDRGEGDTRAKMFIYFARPSLNTWTEQRFGTRGAVERAAAAARLAQASRELKPVVEEWVRALRDGGGNRP